MHPFSLNKNVGKQYQVPRVRKRRIQPQGVPEVLPEKVNKSYSISLTRGSSPGRWEEEERQKRKKANIVRYLE